MIVYIISIAFYEVRLFIKNSSCLLLAKPLLLTTGRDRGVQRKQQIEIYGMQFGLS